MEPPAGIAMLGVTRTLSLTRSRLATNAPFGGVSDSLPLVAQSFGAPSNVLLLHPAGNAGVVTPSKFSEKNTTGLPTWKVYWRFLATPPVSVIARVAVTVAPQEALLVNE